MTCEVPLWVAQVFPSYFNNGKFLKKRKKNTRHFSDLGVETDFGMPQNIPHDTDPRTVIQFTANQGNLDTHFLRPLTIMSPAMVTAFPRLVDTTDPEGNVKPPEIDLTMKGAGEPQERFKAFMDALDEHLRLFMMDNQALLGKKSLTLDQVGMAQRNLFKTRISTKTGRQYPDAMVVRYKGRDSPLECVDKNLNPIDTVANPDAATFNTIVRCVLRYCGSYCRGGAFGNSWELVCVQILGTCERALQVEHASEVFRGVPTDNIDEWPTLN